MGKFAIFLKNMVEERSAKGHKSTIDPSYPIVVNCPSFDENSGGSIVLHYLVDRLQAQGVETYAWPIHISEDYDHAYSANIPTWKRKLKIWKRKPKKKLKENRNRSNFVTHPTMNVPLAPEKILRHSIAVYPEIVSGNPIGAPYVVRWLLNRKGFFNPAEFGSNELMFYYHEVFMKGCSNIDPSNLLRIHWFRDDVYFDHGRSDRYGACRMIRKGANVGLGTVPDGDDAILLDGMSHEDIAAVFNKTEIFYCHDPRTMYLYYAALCDCVPIIVPQPGASFEDLRPLEEERWGIAYGTDGIDWARQTRDRMINRFAQERATQQAMVRNFAHTIREHFG